MGNQNMRILVATDGSEPSGRAVDFAARWAKGLKAELEIIHVVNVDNLALDQLGNYAIGEHVTLGEVLNTFAEEKVAEAKKQAAACGVSIVQSESPFGDPAELIIEAARRDKVDMIVLGKRGRGRLSGLLLGSVSQKVVSIAPCAVVVVP